MLKYRLAVAASHFRLDVMMMKRGLGDLALNRDISRVLFWLHHPSPAVRPLCHVSMWQALLCCCMVLWTKPISAADLERRRAGHSKSIFPWTGCCVPRCETSICWCPPGHCEQAAHGYSGCIWKHILLSGPLFWTLNSLLSPDVGSSSFSLHANNPFYCSLVPAFSTWVFGGFCHSLISVTENSFN